MNSHKYYPLWFRLNQADKYAIWFSNNPDGVVLNRNKMILVYKDVRSVRAYANNLGLTLELDKPILHDLDIVKTWLQYPSSDAVDTDALLAAWNLFDDIFTSVFNTKVKENTSIDLEDIYDKLFRGNNLPAITKDGENYTPIWTRNETLLLSRYLAVGLHDFENRLILMQ